MELTSPEELQWISNLAHWVEGGMFGVVALIALAQALGYLQSKAAQYLWPGLILFAGIFLPAYILLQRGLDELGVTWNLVISDPQQREHFLMALLLLAGGFAEVVLRGKKSRSKLWHVVAPTALALIGAMFLVHTEYGTPDAVAEATRKHVYLGLVIILAGLFKAAQVLWERKFRWLAFPWIGFLFLAALMLIAYREPEGAYKTKLWHQPDSIRLRAPTTLTAHFTFTQEELQCDELYVL